MLAGCSLDRTQWRKITVFKWFKTQIVKVKNSQTDERCSSGKQFFFSGCFLFDSLQKPNLSEIDGSLTQWRVRPPVVYLSGVVFYCGITLLLFPTDQNKTVCRGYIDIWKVLMFIQSFFVQSVFLHMYFLYFGAGYMNVSSI